MFPTRLQRGETLPLSSHQPPNDITIQPNIRITKRRLLHISFFYTPIDESTSLQTEEESLQDLVYQKLYHRWYTCSKCFNTDPFAVIIVRPAIHLNWNVKRFASRKLGLYKTSSVSSGSWALMERMSTSIIWTVMGTTQGLFRFLRKLRQRK